jgi:hypothetical protein
VTSEVRIREDGARLTEQRRREWSEVQARIYARTLEAERRHPALRAARLLHLLELAREREAPFPRRAKAWLCGGEGLAAIDPDDPRAALEVSLPDDARSSV